MNITKHSWVLGAVAMLGSVANAAEPAPAGEAGTGSTGTSGAGTERTSPVLPPAEPGTPLATSLLRGATMEEIAKLRDPIAKTPDEAILALKRGNARFFNGTARRPELSANERRSQILAQTPFAVIIGCADSRVPTEIVFDQGLGSLFVTRVAGNVYEPGTVGSAEYAINHLKTHLIVVLGHEGCGAVKAAMLPKNVRDREASNVRYLLDRIVPSVQGLPTIRDEKARVREAVIANVRLQVAAMRANPVMRAAAQRGQVKVIGGYYEIGSGAVDFLDTEADLRLTAEEQNRAGALLREAARSAGVAHATSLALVEGGHTHEHPNGS